MKLSAQEEYGLRCVLRMARRPEGASITISEISREESLSAPNVAKVMRVLRLGGFVRSVRGQSGGYRLAHKASEVRVGEVMRHLGGMLFGADFCARHAGAAAECTHLGGCSLRALWLFLQSMLDRTLDDLTIQDLLASELETASLVRERLSPHVFPLTSLESRSSSAAGSR